MHAVTPCRVIEGKNGVPPSSTSARARSILHIRHGFWNTRTCSPSVEAEYALQAGSCPPRAVNTLLDGCQEPGLGGPCGGWDRSL